MQSQENNNKKQFDMRQTLEDLKGGSESAYRQVYDQYYGMVLSAVYKLTQSREEASDIAQDVFMRLWETKENLEPEKEISSLLYVIARNITFKLFREKKKITKWSGDNPYSDVDANTSHDIIVMKESEMIAKVITSVMPKQMREIYEMYVSEGLSPEEIAQQLNIKKQTVYSQISRARKMVADIIAIVAALMSVY